MLRRTRLAKLFFSLELQRECSMNRLQDADISNHEVFCFLLSLSQSDTSSSGDSNEIDHSSAVRFYSIHSGKTKIKRNEIVELSTMKLSSLNFGSVVEI